MCSQLKPLPLRSISHLLPIPRSQAATSLPPREYGEHQCLAQKPPSQKPGPGSLHPAVGLQGLRVRSSCLGTGRPALHQGRGPFFIWTIQQATRHPEGGAMDREHRLSWLRLCQLTAAKGRSPQRPQVTCPWERGRGKVVGVPG